VHTAILERLLKEGAVTVVVRVRPHAAKNALTGVMDDGSLKVSITAPAEDGKGNAALSKFLGGLFGIPAANVKILSGKAARLKLVRITAP
jgi:uncharacterized protein (TIGR00251 family)